MFALVGTALAAGTQLANASFTTSTSATQSAGSKTLAAPTGLNASESGSGASATVTVTWTATSSSWATGTRVFRGTASGGSYTQIAQIVGLATTSYADMPGSGTHYYIIRAYYTGNGAGWTSTNSNEATASDGNPQFVNSSTYADFTSYNVTLNVPTGVSAGILLIAVLYTGNPTGYPGDPTTVAMPAGWTVLSNATSAGAEPEGAVLTAYHVATSSEPASYTFSSTNFNNVTAVMLAYANSDGTTPVIDQSAWNSTMTSSVLTPSTPTDTLLTIFGDYNGAVMSVASPSVGVAFVADSVYASTLAAHQYLYSTAPAPAITPSGNSGQGASVTILLKH